MVDLKAEMFWSAGEARETWEVFVEKKRERERRFGRREIICTACKKCSGRT